MKKIIVFITIALFTTTMQGQTYELVPEESTAEWIGYGEIGSFKQVGTIQLKSGSIFLMEGKVQEGNIIFDAESIDHENKDLKKHLRAKDFFYVKTYPEIRFEITGTFLDKVIGNLTIRNKTLEEDFIFSTIQEDAVPIFEGKVTIDRTKYDIKYNSSTYFQDLGNYAIKNEFDLYFKLVFKSP